MTVDGQLPLLPRSGVLAGEDVAAVAFGAGGAVLVRGGAAVAGARGDAWLRVDGEEHARRGGASCMDLSVLDLLGRLPLGVPVPAAWLPPRDLEVLASAPSVAVRRSGPDVVRLLRPPVAVGLVVCSGGSWRSLLRRASAFRHFAPAAVLVDRLPRNWPEVAWEADVAGVGVLVDGGSGAVEALAPHEPGVPRKAAHWRFEERAYRAWVSG